MCSTNAAAKTRLDCHAWKLRDPDISNAIFFLSCLPQHLPHVITLPLENQQGNTSGGRQQQVRQARFNVHADAQARLKHIVSVSS